MDGRIGLRYGHIVHERYWFGANTEQIVHVHCHAINTHAPPLLEHGGDLQFAANAVGGKRKEVVAKLDEPTKTSGQVNRCSECAGRSHAFCERTDKRSNGCAFKVNVHPCTGVVHWLTHGMAIGRRPMKESLQPQRFIRPCTSGIKSSKLSWSRWPSSTSRRTVCGLAALARWLLDNGTTSSPRPCRMAVG